MHDLSKILIYPLFFKDKLKTLYLTSHNCISVNKYNYIIVDIPTEIIWCIMYLLKSYQIMKIFSPKVAR